MSTCASSSQLSFCKKKKKITNRSGGNALLLPNKNSYHVKISALIGMSYGWNYPFVWHKFANRFQSSHSFVTTMSISTNVSIFCADILDFRNSQLLSQPHTTPHSFFYSPSTLFSASLVSRVFLFLLNCYSFIPSSFLPSWVLDFFFVFSKNIFF